jgi:hypothetical protein
MTCGEIIVVYCYNHSKRKHTLWQSTGRQRVVATCIYLVLLAMMAVSHTVTEFIQI